MEVRLHPSLVDDARAQQAAQAVEACVHCGFCLSTCPTYLDTRDERDSPRGRIYLIRELLESGDSGLTTQRHLDRCLGCRACESSCPSGVQYAHIADHGRELLLDSVPRGIRDRLRRWVLRMVVPYPRRFNPLLRLGLMLGPLLPRALRAQLPARQEPLPVPAVTASARRVLLLDGCVQACATPRSNQAARLILDRLGIEVLASPGQGCCGALNSHLGFTAAGRAAMRRNIDTWWPAIAAGAEAILSTATGCGAQLQDYGRALAGDPAYAEKASRVSALALDLASFIDAQALAALPHRAPDTRVALHIPCSLMHAIGDPDSVRRLLDACGYELTRTTDDHLCCGSAGTYSLLQPAMSERLRGRKLQALCGDRPDLIATANVGCQLHLGAGTEKPVTHWTELIWDAIK